MQAILFCPTTSELFLPDWPRSLAAGSQAAFSVAPLLIHRLRALGWPARARLISRKAPQSAGSIPGTLVQLIDALPLLAHPPDATPELTYPADLRAWHRAARLALDLVQRGRLTLRLAPRGRLSWEARWQVCAPAGPVAPRLVAEGAHERAAVLRIVAELPEAIAIPEDARATAVSSVVSGSRLLARFLDGCADTLVREASRRGALVRLRGCPASAWEQRLIRALGEDRATFFWPASSATASSTASGPDNVPAPGAFASDSDAAAIAGEVNAWAADLCVGQAGSSGQLFASPARWNAPEALADVLRRMVRPAALLSQTLLDGQAAPRTLSWRSVSSSSSSSSSSPSARPGMSHRVAA